MTLRCCSSASPFVTGPASGLDSTAPRAPRFGVKLESYPEIRQYLDFISSLPVVRSAEEAWIAVSVREKARTGDRVPGRGPSLCAVLLVLAPPSAGGSTRGEGRLVAGLAQCALAPCTECFLFPFIFVPCPNSLMRRS